MVRANGRRVECATDVILVTCSPHKPHRSAVLEVLRGSRYLGVPLPPVHLSTIKTQMPSFSPRLQSSRCRW